MTRNGIRCAIEYKQNTPICTNRAITFPPRPGAEMYFILKFVQIQRSPYTQINRMRNKFGQSINFFPRLLID